MNGPDTAHALALDDMPADPVWHHVAADGPDHTGAGSTRARRSPALIAVGDRRIAAAGQFPASQQVGAIALRSRALMSGDAAHVLYATAAMEGDGVSTVARELVHAVSGMKLSRTLLLDAHPGPNGQSRHLGGALPDIVAGYEARYTLDVVEIESEGNRFHAARWPMHAVSPVMPNLRKLLHAVYDLIVVDCPPILAHPYLPEVSQGPRQVLLVVRSEVSPVRLVRRAQREIEGLRATVWGVAVTGQRQVVPRFLDRWF